MKVGSQLMKRIHTVTLKCFNKLGLIAAVETDVDIQQKVFRSATYGLGNTALVISSKKKKLL